MMEALAGSGDEVFFIASLAIARSLWRWPQKQASEYNERLIFALQ
jgi:hypothetical protein